MPTFLMLSTVGPDGMATLRANPRRLEEVNEEVSQMGVRIVSQWALLGEYDFATVIEAPDERTMTRVALQLGARGTLKTRTMLAMPVSDFLSAIEQT